MLGAGAFGWKFILFTSVFYLFLAFMIIAGGSQFLMNDILSPINYTASNYTTNVTTVNVQTYDYIKYIFQNPFSGIAFLSWLTFAFLITDIYIIVMSVIP